MSYLAEFNKAKLQGMRGLSTGIPFSVDKLNKVIPGVQKERFYLWGGNSGTGKTKAVNEHLVFTPFDNWYYGGKEYPLDIHYFSLELKRVNITTALAARWLYKQHGILLDNAYLLGYIKDKTLDPYYNTLLESDEFKDYINAFQEIANIMDVNLNPVGFEIYLKDLADSKGVSNFRTKEKSDGTIMHMFDSYEENDERQITIIVVDHIGLVKRTQGQSERQMMIDMADVVIKYRNRYNFTFGFTQQLNRASNSADRHKLEDLLIKDLDFRGSSAPFDAADYVIGIFSPNRERQNTFMGYRVSSTSSNTGLGNRLIVYNGVKSRHGIANWVASLLFIGEIGVYEDLPPPKDFDYSRLSTLRVHY